jgi:hypothetical protein
MTATLNTTIIQNVSLSTPNITLDTVGNAAFGGMPYGALDRVNITTVNGTDTFVAGSINILWE